MDEDLGFDEEETDYEYEYSDNEAEYVHSPSHFNSPYRKTAQPLADTSPSNLAIAKHALTRRRLLEEEYRIIDSNELKIEQKKMIEEIASILTISPSVAAILLRTYSWNKEKLFDKYYTDQEETRKEAGVQYMGKKASTLPNSKIIECQICFDHHHPKEVFGLGCNHMYCNTCWKSYLSVKLSEGPLCIYTTCPSQNCNEVVLDEVFFLFLSTDLYRRYEEYILRSFVDINKNMKWCPSPGCNKIAYGSSGISPAVKCTCGYSFCIKCGEEVHLPALCEYVSSWKDKCRNESETCNWILANTKKCPKCSVRIEKNQGCNHMSCRHCKHEFCWICIGPWSDHGSSTGGYYKCNRYNPETNVEVDVAKAELDKYLHYYQRYSNHSEAGKFVTSMKKGIEKKMIDLQESSKTSSWMDVQFLNFATDQLITCRRVLKYTYVFGYYLSQGKEKNLFEYLQENLEKNTEHLTELIEKPLEKLNRSEIINYTRVTERFLNNLLVGVEDGLTTVNE